MEEKAPRTMMVLFMITIAIAFIGTLLVLEEADNARTANVISLGFAQEQQEFDSGITGLSSDKGSGSGDGLK